MGEAALPAFPCPEAVFQTRVALEETHLMVEGRCSSPPLPGSGTRPASSAALPASLPCLVPRYRASCCPPPHAPRGPFIWLHYSLQNSPPWRASHPSSAPPGPSLRAVWLWAACGGDRRAGWQDPAPRPRPRVSCGTLACPDREDSSPALDPLFSPRCPSLSGSPEAPHSGVKGLPEKLVLIVSKCSSVLYGLAAPTSLSPLYRCVCKVFK